MKQWYAVNLKGVQFLSKPCAGSSNTTTMPWGMFFLWFYSLFTIQETLSDNFVMYEDVSTRNRTKNLCNCEDKTILVMSLTATVDEDVANEYNTVVDIEECINDYR